MKHSKTLLATIVAVLASTACTGIVGLTDVPNVSEAGHDDAATDATRDGARHGGDSGKDSSSTTHDATHDVVQTSHEGGGGDAVSTLEASASDASADVVGDSPTSPDAMGLCTSGFIACDAGCVPATDPNNCGGCGMTCSGTTCVVGDGGVASCEGQCGQGETTCSGSNGAPATPTNNLWTCSPAGAWTEGSPCTGTACVVGTGSASCQGSCAPGQKRCDATSAGVETCADDGNWGASVSCTSQTCVTTGGGDASAGTGTCSGVCAPQQTQCVDPTHVEMCTSTGSWSDPATTCAEACVCPNGATPSASAPCAGGFCGGMCSPGAKECSGALIATCGSSGAWGQPAACTSGVCMGAAPSAACGGCTPNKTQCVGASSATLQTCQANGTWNAGSVVAGNCGAVCTPGTGQPCNGAVPQTCSSVGQEVEGSVTAGQCGATCSPGSTQACNTGQCNPGAVSCNSSGQFPSCPAPVGHTTHSNGVGQNYVDCNALGTYNLTTAEEACIALTGSAAACTSCVFARNGGAEVDTLFAGHYYEWFYATETANLFGATITYPAGRVDNEGPVTNYAGCPPTFNASAATDVVSTWN